MLRSAGGAIGYRLDDSFQTYSVMTRNADGTLSMQCVTGAKAAEKALRSPQSTTTDKEHDHAQ